MSIVDAKKAQKIKTLNKEIIRS